MQLYANNIQDKYGNGIAGASVLITLAAGGALPTLYSDNGITPTANPIIADEEGEITFYAANGRYTLTATGAGIRTAIVRDFELADGLEIVAAVTALAGGATADAAATAADRLQIGLDRIAVNTDKLAAVDAASAAEISAAAALDRSVDAALSEYNAGQSANSAAAAKLATDRIYPGDYATDPLLRPDGTARQVGDEMYNSTLGLKKRWNGATWQASDLNTANLASSAGAGFVGNTPSWANAVISNLGEKVNRFVDVYDAFTLAEKANFSAGLGTLDIAPAIQRCIDAQGASSSAVRLDLRLPRGKGLLGSGIVLPFEASFRGESGRATWLVTNGNFAAFSWSQNCPSYSRNVTISDLMLTGSGAGAGLSNHGILINHPWGFDSLTLRNLWIESFSGYGIKADQQGGNALKNCFQFSHWEAVNIQSCNIGMGLGLGFCGESVFTSVVIQNCTTYGLEFLIGPVAGAQGLQFNNLVVGFNPIGIYLGAGTAGMISFDNLHCEGNTTYGVHVNNTSVGALNFNNAWFANNPVGLKLTAGSAVNINGATWQVASAAHSYITIDAASNFAVHLSGVHKKNGTAPTNEITASDLNLIKGGILRKSATTGTISNLAQMALWTQSRGIASESATVYPNNLTGTAAIANGASSVAVVFTRAETDAAYKITANVDFGAGTAAYFPGVSIGLKTTAGFTAYFSGAAPLAGYSLNWMLMR